MRTAAIETLTELAARDAGIRLMTADLGYGALEAFSGRFPDRFFNLGISEQLMSAAAAGMALSGNVVFTYSIGNFNTLRCIEQIRNDICYHEANVKILSVGGGVAYGQMGMTHHATEDIAMMRALPHMRVLVPADPEEAAAAVRYAAQTDGPCYIRLAKRGEARLYEKEADFCPTKLHRLLPGRNVAILGCGPILREGLRAAGELEKLGFSAGVYSVPCIKPLDVAGVQALAAAYPLLVTLEEHQVTGGLGGAVAEVLGEMSGPRSRLCRLGLPDTWSGVVGSREYLLAQYGLTGPQIAETVAQLLR